MVVVMRMIVTTTKTIVVKIRMGDDNEEDLY